MTGSSLDDGPCQRAFGQAVATPVPARVRSGGCADRASARPVSWMSTLRMAVRRAGPMGQIAVLAAVRLGRAGTNGRSDRRLAHGRSLGFAALIPVTRAAGVAAGGGILIGLLLVAPDTADCRLGLVDDALAAVAQVDRLAACLAAGGAAPLAQLVAQPPRQLRP
jgi:hypothetical protein